MQSATSSGNRYKECACIHASNTTRVQMIDRYMVYGQAMRMLYVCPRRLKFLPESTLRQYLMGITISLYRMLTKPLLAYGCCQRHISK